MSLSPKNGFLLLKQKLRKQVKESLSIRKELKDWSIQDINDFQSDLEANCKSSVSEKWIYLHFKNENEKLPRIDVLNLLAQYCGFKNWEVFLFENSEGSKSKKRIGKHILRGLITIIILSIILWMAFGKKEVQQTIVFEDAYTQRKIALNELTVEIKSKTKPSKWRKMDYGISLAEHKGDSLIVAGPYYKQIKLELNHIRDTIYVKLLPDDYALMLNFYSRSDVKNIEKRESQLEMAIHDEAKIFQVYDEFEGLEILNKIEFIERLILPVNYLKNLEILDIQYKNKQIFRLRFRQKKESYE